METIMRRVALGAFISAFIALPVAAQMAEIDSNGDGKASFKEVIAVFPDVTAEQFAKIDADGNDYLGDQELAAAIDAGDLEELGD